jgi:hypothetical protein
MDHREWLDRYADALGVPRPDDEAVAAVLRLAAVAAHSSERTAAPVACWLAAAAGRSHEEALRIAESVRPAGDAG